MAAHECPEYCERVNELYATIYGNGKVGLEMEHASLMEWRKREEDRGRGNRKLLWLILIALIPIAASRVLDYTSLFRPQQSQTTVTTSDTRDTHDTTRSTTGAKR